MNDLTQGTIFAIHRLDDGAFTRTTVFLKGCPLSCPWCENPEGIRPDPELTWSQESCIFCKECVEDCPEQALSFQGQQLQIDEQKCNACFECVEICPTPALQPRGWVTTVEKVIEALVKDKSFCDQPEREVIFSGGEPLMQEQFLCGLLQAAGKRGLQRTVVTSGYASLATVKTIGAHTDLFLFTLKHLDRKKHIALTGVDNDIILSNLVFLAKNNHPIRLRLPLIQGVNDDLDHIEKIAHLATELPGVEAIDLLPSPPSPPTPKQIKKTTEILQQQGLKVAIGAV